MGFISNLNNYLKEYKWELMLTICMFSNLYPQLPQELYFIVWLAFVYAILKYHAISSGPRAKLTWCMIVLICITTFLSGIIEYRFVMMCLLLYITLATTSYEFYQFKLRFVFVSMIGYVITALLNFYAHLAGINMRSWSSYDSMIDFSGFTSHGMWLGAACGISNIYILYKFYHFYKEKRKLQASIYLGLLFLSIMVSIWAGSRSALAASVLGMCCLLLFITEKMNKSLKLLMGLGVIVMMLLPVFEDNAKRIIDKQQYQESIGETSRDRLWNERIEEFKSSPIIGVGFGVYGIGKKSHGGRTESGSGWLSVLSQTGIVGFLIIIMLIKRAYIPVSVLRNNEQLAFLMCLLIFLLSHTMFEGYLFQSGWYLCLVVWLLVSVLDDYKYFEELEFDDYIYF